MQIPNPGSDSRRAGREVFDFSHRAGVVGGHFATVSRNGSRIELRVNPTKHAQQSEPVRGVSGPDLGPEIFDVLPPPLAPCRGPNGALLKAS
jgi:hypothetical protein